MKNVFAMAMVVFLLGMVRLAQGTEVKTLVEDASPILNVTSDDPRVFTACGTRDKVCTHSLGLIKKLKEKGVVSESYILEGGNHVLSNGSPEWPDFRAATIELLKKHLLK